MLNSPQNLEGNASKNRDLGNYPRNLEPARGTGWINSPENLEPPETVMNSPENLEAISNKNNGLGCSPRNLEPITYGDGVWTLPKT